MAENKFMDPQIDNKSGGIARTPIYTDRESGNKFLGTPEISTEGKIYDS